MSHYALSSPSRDPERARAWLRAGLWAIGRDERHADVLAPGDVALIYVAAPANAFIGRAEIASPVHDWSPPEADAFPGDSPSGVALSDVEQWDPAVSMGAAVRRIDPVGTNPLVQANAAGFQASLVLLTADEYGAVLDLSRDARGV